MTVEAVDVVLDEVGVPLTLKRSVWSVSNLTMERHRGQYRPGDGAATQASPVLVLGIVL